MKNTKRPEVLLYPGVILSGENILLRTPSRAASKCKAEKRHQIDKRGKENTTSWEQKLDELFLR